jgi:hypothetical protein
MGNSFTCIKKIHFAFLCFKEASFFVEEFVNRKDIEKS